MKAVFEHYSHYYDLINSGKDYARETDYVLALARRSVPSLPNGQALNLGCGTGCHDRLLAQRGWSVTGIDRSETMLAIAQDAAATASIQPAPQFIHGDITTIRLKRTFNLVLSLFHVISYQTKNADLLSAFRTAEAHLDPGGLFIFDFWYGPAVLHEKPSVRVKRVENDALSVRRITEPVLHDNTNTVEVNFEIEITEKSSGTCQAIQETHMMRYLFLPEVEAYLRQAGLAPLFFEEWLTGHAPNISSWNVCCVAKK